VISALPDIESTDDDSDADEAPAPARPRGRLSFLISFFSFFDLCLTRAISCA